MGVQMNDRLISSIEQVIRITLKLGDDVVLHEDSDLVSEIGLDSIEAFEAVATLHDLMGVRIPDDIDAKVFTKIGSIAGYVSRTYDVTVVDAFIAMDVRARLAEMVADSELS
jgi:acyl carrier protein